MHTSETMRLMGIVTALAVGCTAGLLAMCWSARKARRRPLRLTRKTVLSASRKGGGDRAVSSVCGLDGLGDADRSGRLSTR